MYEIKAYVREVMAEHVVDALAKVKGWQVLLSCLSANLVIWSAMSRLWRK